MGSLKTQAQVRYISLKAIRHFYSLNELLCAKTACDGMAIVAMSSANALVY